MYYMVTGTCYINNSSIFYAKQLIEDKFTQEYNLIEKKTIEISDYIIPNSNIMRNLINNVYDIVPDQIYDLHEIYEDNLWKDIVEKDFLFTNEEIFKLKYLKKYDIVFMSSNFDRKVKNVDLIKKIFSNSLLENLNKIIIGKNSNKYFNEKEIKNLTVYDFLNQEEIIKLLRKTKIILIPSFIESYSISCIEATNNICIPLLSVNVGCNNFINDYYIVKTYGEDDWVNKILEINNNFQYHTKIFYNHYSSGNKIINILNNNIQIKKKVLFITVDLPGIGGAATNTLNLVNKFKDIWDIYTIFIDENIGYVIDYLENYFIIKNDTNIINNLINLKNKLGFNFDFIFCKNYKCLIYIKNVFKKSNIIFSPSGLRIVMSILHKNYIKNIKLEKMNHSIKYKCLNHVDNFVKDNDILLDFLAFNYSDIIIPNSKLTYELINMIYDGKKINNSIYTTNINYKKYDNLSNENFLKREYDIMFCSYSWSRVCKNVDLVIKLLNILDNKYNILIIGKKINLKSFTNKNITYIENISNNLIKNYFEKTKVVVITSFFDSNPNVLIEAVSCGCNVVTTNNVGNSENLNEKLIISDYANEKEWEEKITNGLKIQYEYNGFDGEKIKSDILKLTKNIYVKKMMVGIYKINPLWDNLKPNNFEYFTYTIKKNDEFINELVLNDIYFILTYKIGISNGMNDINYILVDETIETNECYYVYNSLSYYENFVKIWKIKNRDNLFFFNEADLYFLRGNYHKFYEIFIPNNSKTIFYPATSFKQNICIDNIQSLKNKYSLVLVHEDPRYKKLYENNNCILFNKFTPESFINLNIERIYDLCFVATEIQTTKNHHLFLNFLEYLETNNYNYNCIYVGNLDKITNQTDYQNKFKNIKLEYKSKLSRSELIDIYNKSKNNILFSGRDAFPRVMTESSACGCFNIVLDTLNDGIDLCDGILGKLIGDNNVQKKFISGSLSYLPSSLLWEKIIVELNTNRNHNDISIRYKKKFNLYNLLDDINNVLKNLDNTNNISLKKNIIVEEEREKQILIHDNITC
jgi:hypothetical protein